MRRRAGQAPQGAAPQVDPGRRKARRCRQRRPGLSHLEASGMWMNEVTPKQAHESRGIFSEFTMDALNSKGLVPR